MSETINKSSKRPVSEQSEATRPSYDFGEFSMESNQLTVSPALEKEIKDQGFEYRWIDKAKYIQNQGHYRSWQPYKRIQGVSGTMLTTKESLFGNSPEGYVQSGSAILAVRPKEFGDKHRAQLKLKAEKISSSNLAKQRAAELKQEIRNFGGTEKVTEGYEEK